MKAKQQFSGFPFWPKTHSILGQIAKRFGPNQGAFWAKTQ
jgi:hypothetical protein